MEEENQYYMMFDGKKHYFEEQILALFLDSNILFANAREYLYEGKLSGKTIVLFVNCSDIFAWGVADSEDLDYNEIGELFDFFERDEKWGIAKWCCKKRKEQPQWAVKRKMIEDCLWEAWMDKLELNKYDKLCQENVNNI